MKVVAYTQVEPTVFDTGEMTGVKGRVLIGKADGAANFCMRVFEVPTGAASHYHSHAWEHEVFVHSGAGELLQNGEWVPIRTGDAIFIPGNEVHQLRNPNDAPLVFVCLVPLESPEM